jgi:hypothetical protein
MKSLYDPIPRRKSALSRAVSYCAECASNPISWVVGPLFLGWAHIIYGGINTAQTLSSLPQKGNYEEVLLTLQQMLRGYATPENIVGAFGFFTGKKIWDWIRGKKNE